MPSPAQAPPPAEQRAALQQVTTAAIATLKEIWPDLDLTDGVALREALLRLLPVITGDYGPAASTLAVDVYTLLRDAAGASGGFVPDAAPPVGSARFEALVRWGVDPVFSAEPDPDMALYRVGGGLQKLVADQYRDTIRLAAVQDPAAEGWQREARADGCPFCVMLAGRGAVYKEQTVDFGAHRDCHCLAVPAFKGQPKPVKAYTPTSRTITAADRARTRRWIAEHQ